MALNKCDSWVVACAEAATFKPPCHHWVSLCSGTPKFGTCTLAAISLAATAITPQSGNYSTSIEQSLS